MLRGWKDIYYIHSRKWLSARGRYFLQCRDVVEGCMCMVKKKPLVYSLLRKIFVIKNHIYKTISVSIEMRSDFNL